MGLQCEVGLRCRTYYVLCGSVLSVWNELEEVLTPVSGTNVKVQIVRLRTDDGQRIVGKDMMVSKVIFENVNFTIYSIGLQFHSIPFCFTGLLIPANCVSPLINKLSTSDQSQQIAVQEQQKRQQLHPQSLSHALYT